MTPQPPTPAQQSNALALIAKAAADPALGDAAAQDGAATKDGTPVALTDADLATAPSDQSWKGSWLLFTAAAAGPAGQDRSVMVGQERFVAAVEGNTGTLRWTNPTPWPTRAGDGYLLLRDFRFSLWLRWLNETARNLHYPVDVVVPPADDQNVLRYDLPPPILRAGWLEAVWLREAPRDPDPVAGTVGRAANTIPAGTEARWHRVDVTNAEGDAYVTLPRPVARSQEIVFRARPPFAYEWETPYARWDSVLVPAGRDPVTGEAVRPPVRLFEMGVTWRALQAKLAPLTGQPRQLWMQNLERFARRYAEACEEWRRKEEDRTLGYKEDWYPQGTATAWSLP